MLEANRLLSQLKGAPRNPQREVESRRFFRFPKFPAGLGILFWSFLISQGIYQLLPLMPEKDLLNILVPDASIISTVGIPIMLKVTDKQDREDRDVSDLTFGVSASTYGILSRLIVQGFTGNNSMESIIAQIGVSLIVSIAGMYVHRKLFNVPQDPE